MDPVLIVCGSRTWKNEVQLFRNMNEISYKHPVLAVWHGGAHGADSIAAQWAKARGYEVHVFHAYWRRFSKSAGFKRTAEMIAAAPAGSTVVAFVVGPLEESRGTAFTVSQARKRGLRVVLIEEKDDAEYRVSQAGQGDGELRPHPAASPSPHPACD